MTSTPTVSSVVQLAEMLAQDLMRARLNDMERRITGVTGEPSPPLSSRGRRRSDTGLRPNRPRYPMTQKLRLKQMETLCVENRDEYIYRMTYEVNMDRYAHFHRGPKGVGQQRRRDDPPSHCYLRVGLRISPAHQTDRGPVPAVLVLWSPMPQS